MKSNSSTKARSMIFGALVVLAIATSIVSALYVAGIVGPRQGQTTTLTTSNSPGIVGGYLLARNVTVTTCSFSSVANTTTTIVANITTTSSSMDCLPIGYR